MQKLLLFSLLSLAQACHAEVSESLVYDYYTAHAEPRRSLFDVLSAASPIRQKRQIFHGHTNWYVKWTMRWVENPNRSCRLTKFKVDLSGKILLPKLENANADQQMEFSNYLSELRVHELGHYDIGREAAAAVDKAILALPEMPDCKALEARVNELGHTILRQYLDKELRYDAVTLHGRLQSAWSGS
ncbi:DUF922 domain-containing protein [Undibacterium terreum]|uniref:Secreted Zn-dependent protease n=1 Tax=Undibacterium terreum TaxID=1224302 RepID=A0A916UCU8_9BURK|nr:DUF922 domain-containing protein [Undibacterium terreum]GGC67563.1 hypothetical protein GCM10011396_13210 [Undibacterium terreum]